MSTGMLQALGAIVFLLGGIAVLVQLWRVLTRPGKRLRYLGGAFLTAIATVVAVTLIFPVTPEMRAETEKREREAAAERQRAAEEAAEAEKLAQEKADRDSLAELENCKKDLQCWAERHLANATYPCTEAITKLPQYTMEWTDGTLEPKFSHYAWADKAKSTVAYIGDKARFQNGFGAWVDVVYRCDYDPASQTVVKAHADPGHL